MNAVREALKGDDLERIKKAEEDLQKASHKLAEVMYREAQAKSEPSGAPGGPTDGGHAGGQKGDVVDAEFEDLGEKKDK